MSKFLIVAILLLFGLLYIGNYIEHKKGHVDDEQYNRKNRAFVLLLFICIAIFFYFRRR